MKICSKCGIEKPLTTEFFNKRKKGSLDGFNGVCKSCNKDYMKTYYEENKLELLKQKEQYYEDNKEQISKFSKIYYRENKEKFKKYRQEYFEKNKEQLLIDSKQYYLDNKEKILEQKKQYLKLNKEQIAKVKRIYYEKQITIDKCYHKKRYAKNKEYHLKQNKIYYQENKEKILEQTKQYQKDNPHISRHSQQRRRARINKLPDTLTIEEWAKIKLDFENKCAYCGISEENHLKEHNQQLHQEHFIPLTKGGEYTHNNIIPACKSCNSSKQNKNFTEWYQEQEIYSKQREEFILKYLGYIDNTQQLSII